MDSQVEGIKDKLNIADVVGQYVQLQRAGRNFRARCPFHKERTPSFMVSPDRGTYMCFGCGEKGDIFSFVERIEGVDFKTALRQLADRAGVELHHTFTPKNENKEKDVRLRECCEQATVFFEAALARRKDVEEYLRERAVKNETQTAWRLGYAPASWRDLSEHLAGLGFSKEEIAEAGLAARSQRGEIYDRFRGRIMFPIFDAGGSVIAFSGRFFEKVEGTKEEGEPAKYVNSSETPLFKKSRVLYGFDRAKNAIRKADCALLVEGQFDLILAHQSGLPFTVALSGTALTPEHLSLLGRLSKRLVLALDADAAGIRAGLKSSVLAYAAGFDVKVPALPEGKDPADVAKKDPELLKASIRASKTAIEFFLDALRPAARDERTYKKAVEAQVIPLIAALGSKIDQAHFIRIMAERLRVPEDAVRAEVAKRPALPAEAEEPVAAPASGEAYTPLERTAGLLLFQFGGNTAVRGRVADLLGESRTVRLLERFAPDAERLRFEFEALGEDGAAVAEALFASLERAAVEEDITRARDALRRAAPGEEGELVKKLSDLKRREQELRR